MIEIRCGRLSRQCPPLPGSGRPRPRGARREHAERIFEPFFSGGRGTGLGLFLARELAQTNGATLLYEPRTGGGSIFRLVFADPRRWEVLMSEAPDGHQSSRPAVVLIVDDEPDLLELVSLTLSRMNLETRTAPDLGTARGCSRPSTSICASPTCACRMATASIWSPGSRRTAPSVPVAVITAHGNVESAVRALKLGAFDFVSKPLDLGVLRKLVGSAIKPRRRDSTRRPPPTLRGPRLLGHSAVDAAAARHDRPRRAQPGAGAHLRRVRHRQGTGRAPDPRVRRPRGRALRRRQLRRDPDGAHGKRAVRPQARQLHGRRRRQERLVQSAEGGTLFLDEVADLPLHMQVKLLRVVQEKTVRPVGESREETVDVRILSATHRNLAELVAQGRFREDLFYRINVIELRVPALRERSEDIPEIAEAILERLARRMRHAGAAVSAEDAMRAPASLPLSGQRARARERPRARADSVRQRRDHAGAHQAAYHRRAAAPTAAAAQPAAACEAGDGRAGRASSRSIERDAIVKALEKTRYNKTAAAKLLGMSFRALRYRIKKLGIE